MSTEISTESALEKEAKEFRFLTEFASQELDAKKHALRQYMLLYDKVKFQRLMAPDSSEIDENELNYKSMLAEAQAANEERERNALLNGQNVPDVSEEDTVPVLRLQIAKKTAYIKKLEVELGLLEAIRLDNEMLRERLLEMDKEREERVSLFESELKKMRVAFMEEKLKLKAESARKATTLKKDIETKAIELLEPKTKEIYEKNKTLLSDVKHLEKSLSIVSKDKTILEEKLKKQTLEYKVSEDNIKAYATQGLKQSKELKELQQKVRNLEESLTNTVSLREQDRVEMTAQMEEQREAHRIEVERLQHSLKSRTIELTKIRKLGKKLLEQRTELESFFIAALDQVKQEIVKERELQKKLPRLFTANDSEGRNEELNSKIDVRELSWADKERVLKLLFARINKLPSVYATHSQSPLPQSPVKTNNSKEQQRKVPKLTPQSNASPVAIAMNESGSENAIIQGVLVQSEKPTTLPESQREGASLLQSQQDTTSTIPKSRGSTTKSQRSSKPRSAVSVETTARQAVAPEPRNDHSMSITPMRLLQDQSSPLSIASPPLLNDETIDSYLRMFNHRVQTQNSNTNESVNEPTSATDSQSSILQFPGTSSTEPEPLYITRHFQQKQMQQSKQTVERSSMQQKSSKTINSKKSQAIRASIESYHTDRTSSDTRSRKNLNQSNTSITAANISSLLNDVSDWNVN